MSDCKLANAVFGGQPLNLTYIGYGDCPECGDDCAEFWVDEDGKEYVRCPFIGCRNWGKPTEVITDDR